ncbi:hypothetical protein WN55_07699 [Dufourea novaeangliae]|uniref:Uncharacterized protein n=1 Tax=Dufourea novaeangliae TaxID=178035 RepID=A0A154P7U4_DUFNO|nr:hypothetical protein WN55_07699 [Dufourea novaeangliae]
MVLSDLDQIKKNERDRRRRLRLEQVRQQSKEISDRLLERVKNITKQELKKLENNDKLNLRQSYNAKIMEIQHKYQEDMADIGMAHVSALLEPDHNAVLQEKERTNKLTASKRGKKAMSKVHENQQKETMQQQQHQERLRQVRELENLRSTLVANLPQATVLETDIIQEEVDERNKQQKSAKKKGRKQFFRKSPGKITKSYIRVVASDLKTCSPRLKSKPRTMKSGRKKDHSNSQEQSAVTSGIELAALKSTATTVNTEETVLRSEQNEKNSGKVTSIPKATQAEVDKTLRYNPQDYVQLNSNSSCGSQSDSTSSLSDDSSDLPATGEQSKCTRTPKQSVHSPAKDKVQLYDHSTHQRNVYSKPVGVVEKIHAWTEPSAIDLAQEIAKSEAIESHLTESRKATAQKRGEDAVLREKVRRDYQTLVENLHYFASEERKLKANQVKRYTKDAHVLEERRRVLRDQHKKNLNRAMQALLNEECFEQCPSYPVERQITLAPRENSESDDVRAVWEDPFSNEQSRTAQSKGKENEISREEQILDMLKKVEKQKQLLLKEFGADLPNDIFNATMKPLFERDQSVPAPSTVCHDARSRQAPLSPEIKVINASCCSESSQDTHDLPQDKSIQVEMLQEKGDVKDTNDEVDKTAKHYPIEPKITIVTPEADSSVSASSVVTNTVHDTGSRYSKTTPKKPKRKKTPRKHKSPLVGVSKTPSSAKKLSKTLSRSRFNGLRKPSCASVDTPNKRIKIYINKTGFNIEVNPPQTPEIAVDASTQSSQIFSAGVQEQSTTKLYTVKSQSTRIKMKEVSDTSTSFASPPPTKPRNILEVLNNNISILEMLDSSANESVKLLRRNVSPVSTPETPSPRTMRMPSNIPHPSKISRMLRYTSTDTQVNCSSPLSSSKNDHSSTTDSSGYQQRRLLSEQISKSFKQATSSPEVCTCKNPESKLMHAKFDNICSYTLKNCPEILQKYEDLQCLCTERIVSLTNLIEKVRNEQKGVEFSAISGDDETSLMQLPPPKVTTNDLQSVRDLVENIEAIHNQLAKTLIESQRIVQNTAIAKQESDQLKEVDAEIQTNGNAQNVATQIVEANVEVQRTVAKPRIIRDEIVNIQLDGYKVQSRPKTLETTSPGRNLRYSTMQDEEIIERLSQEILEQSKSLKNNLLATKGSISSTTDQTHQTDVVDSKNVPTSKPKTDTAVQKHFAAEMKGTKDFIPLLADIPKVSRTMENAIFANGRTKPPVSLLSGLYRTDIESSGHELSTIIEFDTLDTVNKSQNIVKSPLSIKKVSQSQKTKTAIVVESPERLVASVNTHNQQQFTKQTINKKLQCGTDNKELSPKEDLLPLSSVNANEENKNIKERITSTSSNSFSELSGISQIASTPSSDILRHASSPEEMEMALKKLGLGWAITTLKKTREASALSSSSNSDDRTPVTTGKRISPVKKQFDNNYGLPDFSDVSSISVKEASKSTEKAVLLKGRTSTPLHSKLQNSNSNSETTNTSSSNVSGILQEPSEGLIIPDIGLTCTKSNIRKLENH